MEVDQSLGFFEVDTDHWLFLFPLALFNSRKHCGPFFAGRTAFIIAGG
jgi:hypothetical protein